MNKRIEISVNQEDVQNIIDCYEKDIKYIKQLEAKVQQLETNRDEVIEFIDIYTDGINLEAFDCLDLMYKIKEILERGKEC